MAKTKRTSSEVNALYYLASGFIIGCVIGRASSSISLADLPSKQQALDTYENAVDVVKELIARAR